MKRGLLEGGDTRCELHLPSAAKVVCVGSEKRLTRRKARTLLGVRAKVSQRNVGWIVV